MLSNFNPDSIENILTQSQFEGITQSMNSLAKKLRVSALILVNSSGRIVAKDVRDDWRGDITLISTLTASSFAAANEMARILGEPSNFNMVLHEGETQNIYVSTVTDSFFLIIIFQKGVALGMVRLFTKRTIEQLKSVLKTKTGEDHRINEVINDRFESLLSDELDRSLKEFNI